MEENISLKAYYRFYIYFYIILFYFFNSIYRYHICYVMSLAMMELIEFIRIRKSILMHCFFIVLFSCVSPFTELEIMIFR